MILSIKNRPRDAKGRICDLVPCPRDLASRDATMFRSSGARPLGAPNHRYAHAALIYHVCRIGMPAEARAALIFGIV